MTSSDRYGKLVVMFLGDKIRAMRLAKGLSQEALAHAAGVSTWTIHRIETHKTPQHRAETLRKVAVALGEEPDFFVIWTTPGPKGRLSPIARAALRMVNR